MPKQKIRPEDIHIPSELISSASNKHNDDSDISGTVGNMKNDMTKLVDLISQLNKTIHDQKKKINKLEDKLQNNHSESTPVFDNSKIDSKICSKLDAIMESIDSKLLSMQTQTNKDVEDIKKQINILNERINTIKFGIIKSTKF
jgi:hypothetical protein